MCLRPDIYYSWMIPPQRCWSVLYIGSSGCLEVSVCLCAPLIIHRDIFGAVFYNVRLFIPFFPCLGLNLKFQGNSKSSI